MCPVPVSTARSASCGIPLEWAIFRATPFRMTTQENHPPTHPSHHFRNAQTSAESRWAIMWAFSRAEADVLGGVCPHPSGPGAKRNSGSGMVLVLHALRDGPKSGSRGGTRGYGDVAGRRIKGSFGAFASSCGAGPVLGCRSSCHGAEPKMAHSSGVSQDAAHALSPQARAIPVDQGQGT